MIEGCYETVGEDGMIEVAVSAFQASFYLIQTRTKGDAGGGDVLEVHESQYALRQRLHPL